MKFKIRYADKIVGFFSLLALAGMVCFIFLLGAKQNWFVKKNNYHTFFESGAGFSTGMDVMYKGFAIGKIKDVRLVGSEALVEFYILEEYSEYVKENSLVELITSPVGLGSSFVLHPGVGPEVIPSGAEIFRIDSPEAQKIIAAKKIILETQEDSIGVLMKKVSSIMDNVNILLYNLNGALSGKGETSMPIKQIVGNVSEITKNLSELTDTLNSEEGVVPALLGENFNSDISEVLKNIAIVSQELNAIGGGAQTIVNNAVPEVDTALIRLNQILLEVQDVFIGLKNNPLIRGGVPDRTTGKSSTTQLRSEDF